jgi:hypothetical protein
MSTGKTSPLQVEVKGASEVMEKLARVVSAKTTQQALDGLGIALLNKATLASPVDTGRERGSFKKGAAGNIWRQGNGTLVIGSEVSHRGVHYPYVHDKPDKYRYHYRSGPFAGQELTGWFTHIGDRSEADMLKALDATKQELLKKWGR